MTGYFIVDLYTLVFYLIFISFGVLWLKSGTHVCLAIVVQNMTITLGDWCFKNENCEYTFFFFKTGLALFIIHGWRPCLHTNLELAVFLLVSFGGHFGYIVGLSNLQLKHGELTVEFSDFLVLLLYGLFIPQGRLFKLLDGFLLLGFGFFFWLELCKS